jgi:Fe-S-cluster containining protein
MSGCKRCGFCCVGMDVEIVSGLDDIPPEMTYKRNGAWYMRQYPNGKCIALSTDDACRIYSFRPTVCKQFEPGEPRCKQIVTAL